MFARTIAAVETAQEALSFDAANAPNARGLAQARQMVSTAVAALIRAEWPMAEDAMRAATAAYTESTALPLLPPAADAVTALGRCHAYAVESVARLFRSDATTVNDAPSAPATARAAVRWGQTNESPAAAQYIEAIHDIIHSNFATANDTGVEPITIQAVLSSAGAIEPDEVNLWVAAIEAHHEAWLARTQPLDDVAAALEPHA